MEATRNTRRQIDRLVLVYAADSGFASSVVDSAKKLLRLKGCSLCAITHGLAGERSQWRECREEIGVSIEAYHRDDLPEEVAAVAGEDLPCVLAVADGELVPILGPEILERMRGDVADFKGRLIAPAAMRGLYLPTAEAPVPASSGAA